MRVRGIKRRISRNTWVAGTLSQEPSCGTAGLQVGPFLPPGWHAQSVVAWREFTGVKPGLLGQWDINSSLVGSGRSRHGMDAEVGAAKVYISTQDVSSLGSPLGVGDFKQTHRQHIKSQTWSLLRHA